MQLSSGWRQPCGEINLNVINDTCQLLELYKVNLLLYLVWTVDIVEENLKYIQALKIWDVVPFSEIPKLEKNIDIFYGEYSMDIMNCCKFRHFDGYANIKCSFFWYFSSSSPSLLLVLLFLLLLNFIQLSGVYSKNRDWIVVSNGVGLVHCSSGLVLWMLVFQLQMA